MTALPGNTSPYPVTEPGLSQSPPRETPALQLGHGETPQQGGDASGGVREEKGVKELSLRQRKGMGAEHHSEWKRIFGLNIYSCF